MATNTPVLGLKKPVPNVEENWAFRLNESLDILDQSLLVGNASSVDNVTTFNDGVGHLLISGSTNPVFDHVEAITFNTEFITVVTGTFSEKVSVGINTVIIGTEIVTTSGIFDEVVVNGVPLSTATPVDNSFKQLLHVREEQPNNTNGGTFTGAVWQVRTLNTVVTNELQGASLSADIITLSEPGDYYIEFSAPAYDCNRHKARLWNVTESQTEVLGASCMTSSNDNVQTVCIGAGKFHIDQSTDLQIQHRCTNTSNTVGFGLPSNFSINEVYTEVRIWPFETFITQLDVLIATSGTFDESLTVSGTPVTVGLGDPLTVTSGTFTTGLNVPHGSTTSGTMTGDFWIDPTTSGLRWEFNGVVFEAQGIEVV